MKLLFLFRSLNDFSLKVIEACGVPEPHSQNKEKGLVGKIDNI
jgi:hypothetical protein